jgi:hypothetical protein
LTKWSENLDDESSVDKEDYVFALLRTLQTGVGKIMSGADNRSGLPPDVMIEMTLVIGGVRDNRQIQSHISLVPGYFKSPNRNSNIWIVAVRRYLFEPCRSVAYVWKHLSHGEGQKHQQG